ncbi:MbcA/ParS/Xre antitoxin family protein [Thalassospira sp.]|uniref:MbcA/ParS/Xre antitoxin family protein n=1 Tax=Thalassospira sp. TaxID=1912094 RepID=UPI002733F002|nr:MbcA/ParS/Xre antitoxin family protein [Thalassospira sp.]MDP2699742.1 MbcA/ParS/Xre antitoxin family protein [Thalassospira sp.]
MRVAYAHEAERGVPSGDLEIITDKNRRDVSAPGLKAFKAITERWGLNETQQRTLLGEPSRSTFYGWLSKAAKGEKITLSLDTLLRISNILGIHKSLAILFIQKGEAMTWLKGKHNGLPFAGQSPLEVMLNGKPDDLSTVRRYLDGWRGGLHGAPDVESGVPPVAAGDIVWA